LFPFYISYYGWWNYRLQFCEAYEASWFMLVARQKDKDIEKTAEDTIKKVFEHYLEWEFLYTQVYSPHEAEFVEDRLKSNKIIYYDYEDGGIFYFDEDEAVESLPDYCWKVIEKSESEHFESFDLIKTDNQ
jgi:hypothetical protein